MATSTERVGWAARRARERRRRSSHSSDCRQAVVDDSGSVDLASHSASSAMPAPTKTHQTTRRRPVDEPDGTKQEEKVVAEDGVGLVDVVVGVVAVAGGAEAK